RNLIFGHGDLDKLTLAIFLAFIAATCIRTNQNPNSVRRRFSPPHTIWVLCPNKNGNSYK
ncbi:MAG: hypothetical protein ACK59J_09715, partial [Pseudanabaena sp.]